MEHTHGTPAMQRRRRRVRVGPTIVLITTIVGLIILGLTGTLSSYVQARLVEAARSLPPRYPFDSDYFGLTARGQLEVPYHMLQLESDGSWSRTRPANEAQYERQTTRKLWYLRMEMPSLPTNARLPRIPVMYAV